MAFLLLSSPNSDRMPQMLQLSGRRDHARLLSGRTRACHCGPVLSGSVRYMQQARNMPLQLINGDAEATNLLLGGSDASQWQHQGDGDGIASLLPKTEVVCLHPTLFLGNVVGWDVLVKQGNIQVVGSNLLIHSLPPHGNMGNSNGNMGNSNGNMGNSIGNMGNSNGNMGNSSGNMGNSSGNMGKLHDSITPGPNV